MQFSEKLNTGDVKKSKKIKNTQHKYYLFHFLNPNIHVANPSVSWTLIFVKNQVKPIILRNYKFVGEEFL